MQGWNYVVDEGGGAFYGPKIDIKIQDALGRKWQCSTVQVCCTSSCSTFVNMTMGPLVAGPPVPWLEGGPII